MEYVFTLKYQLADDDRDPRFLGIPIGTTGSERMHGPR